MGEARDWGDVLLELADRMGFLGDVYKDLNHRYDLKDPYKLDPAKKYTREEIGDRRFKSQFGEEKGWNGSRRMAFSASRGRWMSCIPCPGSRSASRSITRILWLPDRR